MWSSLLLLGLCSGSALAHPPRLNNLAVKAGKLWFGTAADIPGTAETTDAAYLKLLKENFGEVTPANAMKVQNDNHSVFVPLG